MPDLPHDFPTLRQEGEGDPRRSILIIGAGMSWGLVPGPDHLIKAKRVTAEAKLGLNANMPVEDYDLYKWADHILTALIDRGDAIPKLVLAKSLDIPEEAFWRGSVSTQRNTPRHRIIARFAREGLWEQIWSFNWDCVQESAFENVGIMRDGADAGLPWPTGFRWFITAAECAAIVEEHPVKLIKPHGCVMALVKAEQASEDGNNGLAVSLASRFLITATELTSLAANAGGDPTQEFVFGTLTTKLWSHPCVIAGWKISEEYLIAHFEKHLPGPLAARPLAEDELSIVDILFNGQGHTRMAALYGRNQDSAHIPVQSENFTTDRFFLWVQARYALGCLRRCALAGDRPALEELEAHIAQPPDAPSFLDHWADSFLPTWVLLCWRYGFVSCCNRLNNEPIRPEDLKMASLDEHIPWGYRDVNRTDLRSAGSLLAALHRNGNADQWDFARFPGGLFRGNRLVIPVPVWDTVLPNDLRGLKALIEAMKKHGDAYIHSVAVLPLQPDPAHEVSMGKIAVFKELVARDLALSRFRSANIENIALSDL